MTNEQSEFKPEWKHHSINYEDTGETLQYEFPYIYFSIIIITENYSESSQDTENLFSNLLKSQDYFEKRVFYRYDTGDNVYPNVTSIAFLKRAVPMGPNYALTVSFRLQMSEPPRNDGWFLVILLDMGVMSSMGEVSIENLSFKINREKDFSGLPILLNYELDDNMVDVFIIEYQEAVTHKYNSNYQYSSFDVTWSHTVAQPVFFTEIANFTLNDSWIYLDINPNFEVDHWWEYVAFGYSDWLTGMGGLFSLMTTSFLWFSYCLSLCYGDGVSMGILPGLSFNFFSYEGILWMKNKLSQSAKLRLNVV